MNKKSKHYNSYTETGVAAESTTVKHIVEWACEGREKAALLLVIPDGNFTRYKEGMYDCT